MLEKMDSFFEARVDGYDEHMKSAIEGASDFYEYTASLLPRFVWMRLKLFFLEEWMREKISNKVMFAIL